MKILFWIIVLPILALVGAFAAANHGPVTLRLWPFPYEMELPVYGAVLGAFALGFAVAGLWVWIAALPARLGRRRLARQEKRLEDEVVSLREQLAAAQAEAERARKQTDAGARASEGTTGADRRGLIAGAD